ncbi:MAG: DNA polymerase III subunit delta [candidate division WOR-3 bacterium]
MMEKEFKEQTRKKVLYNHYFLVSEESLLINNAINDIKQALNVDESFDFESCSVQEYEYPDLVNKILTAPFASSRRVVVLKNIEKESHNNLKEFALMLGRVPSSTCLVMVYQMDKKGRHGRGGDDYKKILELFPDAHCVILSPDETTIHKWIVKKMESLGIRGCSDIVNYLKEEFSDDITGLKNEIQKIENYLFQAKQLGLGEVKEISRGLSDYDVYHMANDFFQHRHKAIEQFVELKPYIRTPAIVIDAMGRLLRNHALRSDDKSFRYLAAELLRIDSRLKTGSDFVDTMLEIFIIKNLGVLSKGVIYG